MVVYSLLYPVCTFSNGGFHYQSQFVQYSIHATSPLVDWLLKTVYTTRSCMEHFALPHKCIWYQQLTQVNNRKLTFQSLFIKVYWNEIHMLSCCLKGLISIRPPKRYTKISIIITGTCTKINSCSFHQYELLSKWCIHTIHSFTFSEWQCVWYN